MPKYILHYFNSKGRAEPARLIFAYAGQEYEDRRIPKEDWPNHKSKMPFGQVPCLEVDGKMLGQSMAISRYLARQFKLAGKDDWEAAQCDALADGWGDVMSHMRVLHGESDPEKKKLLAEQISKDHIEPFLSRYEKFLADNGGNFFVGNQITWVDLMLSHVFRMGEERFPNAMAKHPKIIEFAKKIEEIPNIKKWIESRPKTEM